MGNRDDNWGRDIPSPRSGIGPGIKWGLAIAGVVAVVAIGGSVLSTLGSVATAPGRVISRTLETGNIISNYEWYHDAYGQYRSRIGQIADVRRQLEAAGDDRAERNRLNVDLGAIRQSCRDLATRYNANATKTNRSIFMGREAPESLNMEACG